MQLLQQESIVKRVTSLSNATRNIAKDAATTTIKVAAVEEKAAAVEKKADAATEKIADVATTATAAAEKVETVAAKAEKAAEEVSHVATDAANANNTAKEAKTMATEANNKAEEVKATVEDMANAFSHDEKGAHVGDKNAAHVTVNNQGMSIYNDAGAQIANFDSSTINLNNGVLNIAANYQDNLGYKATALMTNNILLKPAENFAVGAKVIAMKASRGDGKHSTSLKLTDSDLSININSQKSVNIENTNLLKLIKFTPWVTLMDNGVCRIRYCLRGGFMYLDCYLAAGYSTYTSTAELPKEVLPAIEGCYPMGTQTGNNTAKIWVGSADGNDGHVYLYNYSSGYATGLFTFIPKSLE